MRFDAGRTDIPSAGTRVRLSSDAGLTVNDRILWARFRCVKGNTGHVWVGIGDVSATHGWELEQFVTTDEQDSTLIIEPGKFGGSIPAGDIYFDAASNGDDIEWALILE